LSQARRIQRQGGANLGIATYSLTIIEQDNGLAVSRYLDGAKTNAF
jgi:hypothetical protein